MATRGRVPPRTGLQRRGDYHSRPRTAPPDCPRGRRPSARLRENGSPADRGRRAARGADRKRNPCPCSGRRGRTRPLPPPEDRGVTIRRACVKCGRAKDGRYCPAHKPPITYQLAESGSTEPTSSPPNTPAGSAAAPQHQTIRSRPTTSSPSRPAATPPERTCAQPTDPATHAEERTMPVPELTRGEGDARSTEHTPTHPCPLFAR
jgi:hypothetical protein